MDTLVGNITKRMKLTPNIEGKRMAIKLMGFYAMGWTLRKLLK